MGGREPVLSDSNGGKLPGGEDEQCTGSATVVGRTAGRAAYSSDRPAKLSQSDRNRSPESGGSARRHVPYETEGANGIHISKSKGRSPSCKSSKRGTSEP